MTEIAMDGPTSPGYFTVMTRKKLAKGKEIPASEPDKKSGENATKLDPDASEIRKTSRRDPVGDPRRGLWA